MAATSVVLALALISAVGFVRSDDEVNTRVRKKTKKLISLSFIFYAFHKVHLKVYYESLCPDSVRFIRNQLLPTWNSLGSQYLEVDFLPFGKAQVIFVCILAFVLLWHNFN